MPETATRAGYTATAKSLHWLILALLIVQFTTAWTMPHIGRNTKPETLINLHFSLGAVVLLVVVIRLVWRAVHGKPAYESDIPRWQIRFADVVHGLLYLLLIVIPVLGWMNASFRGFSVSLFGLFEMPKLLATRQAGFAWTGDVHALLATYALLGLVGLHVLAGLYHNFIRRDGVLQRMLPQR